MLNVEALTDCLQEAIGLSELRLLTQRPESAVFSAIRGDERVIAKCSELRRVEQEAEVLRLLKPSGILAPPVREFVKTTITSSLGQQQPLGVLVLGLLPGERLDWILPQLPPGAAVHAWREAGCALGLVQRAIPTAELQAAKFWRRHLAEQSAAFSWRQSSIRRVRQWIATIRQTIDASGRDFSETLDWLRTAAEQELREPAQTALLHCDYSPRNILFDSASSRVVGVIDFESATLGDPQYDLAKSTWLNIDGNGAAEERCEAFISGWMDASGWAFSSRTHRIYEAMQGLAAIAWADAAGPIEHAVYREQGVHALVRAYQATQVSQGGALSTSR
jgi:hypothetical protein